jgi:serine/threonine protein kinase
MVDGNSGRAMLIDFGIARSVNKEEKGVTAVGTMGYAPPESSAVTSNRVRISTVWVRRCFIF